MDCFKNNGKALDAVEKGVMVTENDLTNRSVGIGGRPDRDGHVTLDACIMDERSRCGAVAFVENYKHPIQIARKVMETTQHVLLVGEGAEDFAAGLGYPKVQSPIPEVQKDYEKWREENADLFKKPEINHENHDTIGMIAMDSEGNFSGACTTSGWAYKMHGRVGDSPIIGAGLFIDNEVGAATATGLGEAIIRIAGAHTVVECMRHGMSAQEACEEAVNRIIAKHEDLTGLQVGFWLLIEKETKVLIRFMRASITQFKIQTTRQRLSMLDTTGSGKMKILFFLFLSFQCFSQSNRTVLTWSIFHPVKSSWFLLGEKGSVQSKLHEIGELPDPFFEENEALYLWVEQHPWHFQATLFVTADQLKTEYVDLVLPQVDTYSSIFVNGTKVGETDNAFKPFRFSIQSILKQGSNTISVYFLHRQ